MTPTRFLPLALLFAVACQQPAPQIITTTLPAPATAPAQAPGLTVVGTAQLDVQPDTAELHVTLSATAARPGEAVKAARARQAAFAAAIAPIGLEPADVTLSQMSISPVYEYPANRVKGYEAAIQVTAQTKNFDKLGPLMDAAADAGASNLHTMFRADLTVLKKKVRDMALGAAKDKATQMAAGLGVTLGTITAISETTDNGWMPQMYVNVMNTQPAQPSGQTSPDLQPVILSISVTYTLGV